MTAMTKDIITGISAAATFDSAAKRRRISSDGLGVEG